MYKAISPIPGIPPIEFAVAVPATLPLLGVVPGMILTAYDPVWGPGELIFARASTAIPVYQLCTLLPVWNSTLETYTMNATPIANTANLGSNVAVAQVALTTGQYGWFLMTGNTPVSGTATVAAGTKVGITAAGQVGANTAGKEILNAVSVTGAANTVVKVGRGVSGSDIIFVPETDGFFVGGYMSGTGVGSSAIILALDPLGSFIQVSVVNSAAIAGNVTQTANNGTIFYNICRLNRSFAQGAIT
jgi:hypothetical protein